MVSNVLSFDIISNITSYIFVVFHTFLFDIILIIIERFHIYLIPDHNNENWNDIFQDQDT